jgi:hypothetical protein
MPGWEQDLTVGTITISFRLDIDSAITLGPFDKRITVRAGELKVGVVL